jgi:hypothetical protein
VEENNPIRVEEVIPPNATAPTGIPNTALEGGSELARNVGVPAVWEHVEGNLGIKLMILVSRSIILLL